MAQTKPQTEAAFKLRVIGRSPAHITGNEDHVSACLLAGPDTDHLSLAGTLTVTEEEWQSLVRVLRRAFGEGFLIEDWTEVAS